MSKISTVILVICYLTSTYLFSQHSEKCAHKAFRDAAIAKNPAILEIAKQNERLIQQAINQLPTQKTNNHITIPVVFHIIYNTPEQNVADVRVTEQLDVLNADFEAANTDKSIVPTPFQALIANSEIQFCLAKTDPIGNTTTGITRTQTQVDTFNKDKTKWLFYTDSGGVNIWNPKQYLNIYVCPIEATTLGFASFPDMGQVTPAEDGVVINFWAFGKTGSTAPNNLGRTATHEVGHYLNLFHIWGDENCGNDSVADTPEQADKNNGCPTFPKPSNCPNNGPNGDLYNNYMDYTDDNCTVMFTKGQAARMNAALQIPWRNTLTTATACNMVSTEKLINPQTHLKVYPNPAHNQLFVELNTNETATFSLHDALGKVVYTNNITTNGLTTNTIDLSKLNAGIYNLTVRIGNQTNLKRVVVR